MPLTVFRRTDEGRLETVYSGKGPARSELESEQAARLEKETELEAEQAARRAETEAHEREVGALKTQLREAQAKATTMRPRRGPNPKAGGK